MERLDNYVSAKLVRIENLKPYIGYWLEDIHSGAENPAVVAWTAALLTYIEFYRFRGVQHLFKEAGKPIDPASEAYLTSMSKMEDRDLAAKFAASVLKTSAHW